MLKDEVQLKKPTRVSGTGRLALALASVTVLSIPLVGAADESPPSYVGSFGFLGSGPGQMRNPEGIGIDASGNVYVADSGNSRIEKFSADGTFLLQWGGPGTGFGTFNTPWGIDCDSHGNVYVADPFISLVQKFSPTGQFITQWDLGPYSYASQLCVDDSDFVYVADPGVHEVLKFDSGGTLAQAWGGYGTGPAQFDVVSGVAYAHGRIYAADQYAGRVEVFDTVGNYQGDIGVPGQGYGELYYPKGMDTDTAGNLYIASSNNWTLTELTSSGVLLTQWGAPGHGPGQYGADTYDIAVHPSGRLYVVDRGNSRVQIYEPGVVPSQMVTWGLVKDRYRH
jgi:tripartite motif-containing protein 71